MSEMESQLEECGVCHALHPYNELACFDDTLICAECLEDSTVICGRCGERLWRDDDQVNEDSGHLCQSCYDRYYNTCDECHRIICEEDAYYEDDDRVLCYDCHRHHRSRYSINDYSYKPDPSSTAPTPSTWVSRSSWMRAARATTRPGSCWRSPTPRASGSTASTTAA